MSGGHYNYAYLKLLEFKDDLEIDSDMRAKFAEHLEKVAQAMKDIEWFDSGDVGDRNVENQSIAAVLAIFNKDSE